MTDYLSLLHGVFSMLTCGIRVVINTVHILQAGAWRLFANEHIPSCSGMCAARAMLVTELTKRKKTQGHKQEKNRQATKQRKPDKTNQLDHT